MPKNEQLTELVTNLLQHMGVKSTVRVQDRETAYFISIDTEDSALLIGRAGETLQALQAIVRLLAYKLELGDVRIMVDVNAYRREREEELLTYVDAAANRVKDTGTSETLRPMTSYERHLVHEVIGQMDGLATESAGDGLERRVTVSTA